MKEAIDAINEAINATKALPRSRDTNIAITHLETALLWIEKADSQSED